MGRDTLKLMPVAILALSAAAALAMSGPGASSAKVTFGKEVSRIVQAKCQSCHRPDGVAPFPLTSYEQVSAKAEAKPGCKAVHHILVYIQKPGTMRYDGLGNTPMLCGEAPGDQPTLLPPSVGVKIPAGAKLLFEIHYTPTGKIEHDRSSIAII